jgi:hypothetical protein
MEEWQALQPFSKRIAFLVASALLASGLPGCALLATKPLAAPAMRGRLADNVYTSPQRSFRIRMPWLSTVGIGPEAPSVWYVNRESVDEALAYFAEGFEILGTKER